MVFEDLVEPLGLKAEAPSRAENNKHSSPGLKPGDFCEGLKRLSPTLKKIAFKLSRAGYFFNNEDLFQEAVIHLWHDFNLGKLNDKTDSYILQGCYFHLKNYIRTAKVRTHPISLDGLRVRKEDSEADEYFMIEPADEGWRSYKDRVDAKLLADTIRNNGLTHKEKYILSLCQEGMTTREIGERIGTSHVMVVKSMKRIRRKCRRYLDISV